MFSSDVSLTDFDFELQTSTFLLARPSVMSPTHTHTLEAKLRSSGMPIKSAIEDTLYTCSGWRVATTGTYLRAMHSMLDEVRAYLRKVDSQRQRVVDELVGGVEGQRVQTHLLTAAQRDIRGRSSQIQSDLRRSGRMRIRRRWPPGINGRLAPLLRDWAGIRI